MVNWLLALRSGDENPKYCSYYGWRKFENEILEAQMEKVKSGCSWIGKKKAMTTFLDIFIAKYDKERSTWWPISRRDWASLSNLFLLVQASSTLSWMLLKNVRRRKESVCEKKDENFIEEKNTEVWESFDNFTQAIYLLFSLICLLFSSDCSTAIYWILTNLLPRINWQKLRKRRSNKSNETVYDASTLLAMENVREAPVPGIT